MLLFLLGGTGRTGEQFIDLALASGHQVTAFVRSPWKIRREDPGLHVVGGNPRDARALAAAMPGHEALVSALGPESLKAMTRSTLLRDCAAASATAMRAAKVKRVAVVSSALLFPGGGLPVAIARRLIGPHLQDLRRMEEVFIRSGLGWTIVRPPRLVHSPDASYRAEIGVFPGELGARAWLSWRALAAFLLDSVAGGRHTEEVVGLRH